MLEFHIDNKVSQTAGIPTLNHSLSDSVFHLYETEFILKLINDVKRCISQQSTFRLSITISEFVKYLRMSHPPEFDIRVITNTRLLGVFFWFDTNGKMKISMYDERGDFKVPMVNLSWYPATSLRHPHNAGWFHSSNNLRELVLTIIILRRMNLNDNLNNNK